MKRDKPEHGERTDKCRYMKHKCERDGCFEAMHRCRLGKLDHLLPGNNGMTDVDSYCHINGQHFFMEWKSGQEFRNGGNEPRQLAAYVSLSRLPGVTVCRAWGDPQEMTPIAWQVIENGEVGALQQENPIATFDAYLEAWGLRAAHGPHGPVVTDATFRSADRP